MITKFKIFENTYNANQSIMDWSLDISAKLSKLYDYDYGWHVDENHVIRFIGGIYLAFYEHKDKFSIFAKELFRTSKDEDDLNGFLNKINKYLQTKKFKI